MLLYQPTDNEITATLARLVNHHPHLKARADKAAAILADVDRCFDCDDTDHWNIRSNCDSVNWYPVNTDACDCPDYQINRSKTRTGIYYCKHRLAFHGYRHLLSLQLLRRTVGNLKYESDRSRAQLHEGSVILVTDDKRPRYVAYSPFYRFPRHLCYVRLDKLDRLVPQRLGDYVAVAEWLPTVPGFSLPQPEPRMEDYYPDRQPEMTHEDFQHWMATGDTPAMRINY